MGIGNKEEDIKLLKKSDEVLYLEVEIFLAGIDARLSGFRNNQECGKTK